MVGSKGASLEELVRSYFSKQGFYALRSVPLRYDGFDVTDIDVWLYARQSAGARVRGVVDVKNKKSPKAFERILWVKGIQSVVRCDRAIVATTDNNPSLVRFAQSQGVSVLTKNFLERLEKKLDQEKRISLEEHVDLIKSYSAHKQDGDWVNIILEAKSALASIGGFPAFNKAMFAFKFFADRAEVRTHNQEEAVRCALFAAGLACIALDSALEKFTYDQVENRFSGLIEGITYGDSGDGRMKQSIETALAAIAESMENGRAIAAQAKSQLQRRLQDVRADIVAEYFMREHNSQHLFAVARELDDASFTLGSTKNLTLSLEARSILGVFADFVAVKRSSLPIAQRQVDTLRNLKKVETPSQSTNEENSSAEGSGKQESLL